MEEENVHLARRRSGGGAVYQDLGNSIWTFIEPRNQFSMERNITMVKNAIGSFGIDSEFSGRNDIHVKGKKVSGSAFKQTPDKSLHHGTILVNIDKDRVERYLNVNKEKLKSKGVDSVRQRILNLNDINPSITHEAFCESIIKEFNEVYKGNPEVEIVNQQELHSFDSFTHSFRELEDWNWRFGKTPKFEYSLETRFPWGIIDLHLTQVEGKISSIKIYSDSLYPQMIEMIESALHDVPYNKEEILKVLSNVKETFSNVPLIQEHITEFGRWFTNVM